MSGAADLSSLPLAALVSLAGQVAVVTGAGRGIGLACARRLAEAGAHVFVTDVDGQRAAAAARGLGGRIEAADLDVRDTQAVAALADRALERHGRLDVWVSNAGVYPSGDALALDDAAWDAVLDLDLRAVFVCARESARRMLAAGNGGVIVNVSSTASFRVAGRGIAHYAAAKHGVTGLTKSLAVEFGPLGIRVVAVAPAVTRTEGIEEARPALERGGFELDGLAGELPLRRLAVPDDVARVVLFAACGLAGFVSGSTIAVDGGWLAT